jgi:predicted anti-sigma-YlaC factor YlaD
MLEITCAEVRQELSNYVDDDVTPALRAQMEAHFAHCRGCRAIYDGVRNVIRLIGDTEVIELPEGFSRRLYTRITAATAN